MTVEVFGSYIHTYKFNEAVEDKVVLDLVYEARDVDQKLGSQEKVDAWFEAKTRGLNAWQKQELKKQWGTLQRVLSSKSRMDKVVSDILFDFGVKPRLSSERGNAMLVASSIYEASRYFELFQKTSWPAAARPPPKPRLFFGEMSSQGRGDFSATSTVSGSGPLSQITAARGRMDWRWRDSRRRARRFERKRVATRATIRERSVTNQE